MILWLVMGLNAGCALGYTAHTERTGILEVSRIDGPSNWNWPDPGGKDRWGSPSTRPLKG